MEETEVLVAEPTLVTMEMVQAKMEKSKIGRLHDQAANGVINPIVLAKFLDIAPQQIYNRIRAGKIATVDVNSTQKLVIPIEEAQRFASMYLDRKARQEEAARLR